MDSGVCYVVQSFCTCTVKNISLDRFLLWLRGTKFLTSIMFQHTLHTLPTLYMNQPASIVPYWHGAPLSSFTSRQNTLLALGFVGAFSYGFGATATCSLCKGAKCPQGKQEEVLDHEVHTAKARTSSPGETKLEDSRRRQRGSHGQRLLTRSPSTRHVRGSCHRCDEIVRGHS